MIRGRVRSTLLFSTLVASCSQHWKCLKSRRVKTLWKLRILYKVANFLRILKKFCVNFAIIWRHFAKYLRNANISRKLYQIYAKFYAICAIFVGERLWHLIKMRPKFSPCPAFCMALARRHKFLHVVAKTFTSSLFRMTSSKKNYDAQKIANRQINWKMNRRT